MSLLSGALIGVGTEFRKEANRLQQQLLYLEEEEEKEEDAPCCCQQLAVFESNLGIAFLTAGWVTLSETLKFIISTIRLERE